MKGFLLGLFFAGLIFLFFLFIPFKKSYLPGFIVIIIGCFLFPFFLFIKIFKASLGITLFVLYFFFAVAGGLLVALITAFFGKGK